MNKQKSIASFNSFVYISIYMHAVVELYNICFDDEVKNIINVL